MRYVTSVERLGIEKGIQQGRGEGKAEGKAEMLLRQFRRRDKTMPSVIEDRVRAAGTDQLDEWNERFADGKTLAEIFDTEQLH